MDFLSLDALMPDFNEQMKKLITPVILDELLTDKVIAKLFLNEKVQRALGAMMDARMKKINECRCRNPERGF